MCGVQEKSALMAMSRPFDGFVEHTKRVGTDHLKTTPPVNETTWIQVPRTALQLRLEQPSGGGLRFTEVALTRLQLGKGFCLVRPVTWAGLRRAGLPQCNLEAARRSRRS